MDAHRLGICHLSFSLILLLMGHEGLGKSLLLTKPQSVVCNIRHLSQANLIFFLDKSLAVLKFYYFKKMLGSLLLSVSKEK